MTSFFDILVAWLAAKIDALLVGALSSLLAVFLLFTSKRLSKPLRWLLKCLGAAGKRALVTLGAIDTRRRRLLDRAINTPSLLIPLVGWLLARVAFFGTGSLTTFLFTVFLLSKYPSPIGIRRIALISFLLFCVLASTITAVSVLELLQLYEIAKRKSLLTQVDAPGALTDTPDTDDTQQPMRS